MLLKFFTPSLPLQPYIEKMWVFESDAGIPSQDMRLIVPNGQFKLIIPYRNGLKSNILGIETIARQGTITFIGLAESHAIIDSLDKNFIASIGIEFRPFAAYKFLQHSLKDLSNQVLTAEEVLGVNGKQLQRELEDCITPQERIRKIEKYLIDQLHHRPRSCPVTDYSVAQLVKSSGVITMKNLSSKTGYTTRYLEKKFQENIGVSPKTLAGILKFQKFYQWYGRNQEGMFFHQEMHHYYFDQSHFIRDFKKYTGMTPLKFLKSDNEFGKIFYRS